MCGVAGSSPSLNHQSKDKVKLMIDSGSQSTACSVDFAKGYATDDTERAKLWDIQDQKIEAHGKRIVDVKFHGQANETPVPASIKEDVSDVARNVASMGRLLRAGFDLHFTNHGHTCWMVQDERKTSRSQEIDVNSFCEEPSSSERTGRLVTGSIPGKPVHETSVIQTRSSEDRKDFNVEQAHERTERPVITHDVINVSDSSQTRSAHESETFNVGDEILRKRTERSVADHDVSHESMMVNEADMDFRIPGLPHSVVKHAQSTSVRELIQKIENHPDRHVLQQDLRQNQSFNPFSPESKKK